MNLGETTVELIRYTAEMRPHLEAFYDAFEPKGASLGLPPRSPDAIRDWLNSIAMYPSFVVRVGERIVGHSLLCPDTYTGEVAVFVGKDYRGRGLGQRLLLALIAEAMELDLRRVWGISEPDNVAMLRLAHKCGFQPGKDLGEFFLEMSRAHEGMPQPANQK